LRGWPTLVLAAAAVPAVQLPDVGAVREAVIAASAKTGAAPPRWDPRLAAAASRAAERAEGLDPPAELEARVEALGVGDPAPSAFLVEGPTVEAVASVVARRLPVLGEPATDFGVGLARQGPVVRAVVVRTRRKAFVASVPTSVTPGQTVSVAGRLVAGLQAPSLYVEEPDGRVVTLPLAAGRDWFRSELTFRSPGPYRVELMGRGPRGPEVAWLYTIEAGTAPAVAPEAPAAVGSGNPRTDARQVFDAINRDRLELGEPALAFDPRLAALARAYSRELGELHLLAHVSPRSGDLPARLRRAGYAYARAGENLAQGLDALQAHALAAQSPAHRRNMLDPTFDRCGVGVAEVLGPDRRPSVIVTELFAGG